MSVTVGAIRVAGMVATIVAALGLLTPTPATARGVIPPMLVGPPEILMNGNCAVSVLRSGGTGPGAAIPFPALKLGAPVMRTTTSFTTGGSGTSNMALAAQRKAAGLPYEPPTVNPDTSALPATFAVDRTASPYLPPYQRMQLTPSRRVAEPYGLIFAETTSPTRGRIAALVLSIAGRPKAPPRVRLSIDGPPDRGCRAQIIDIYAPAMSVATLSQLSVPAKNRCGWYKLATCPRAQWPYGRVLFVSLLHDTTYEYRWVDYDLLADWYFARARS